MNSDDNKLDKMTQISQMEAMKIQSDDQLNPLFESTKLELESLKKEMKLIVNTKSEDSMDRKQELLDTQAKIKKTLDNVINARTVGKKLTEIQSLQARTDDRQTNESLKIGKFSIWLQKMDRDEYKKSSNFASSLKQICEFSLFSEYVTLAKSFPMLVDPVAYMTNMQDCQKCKVRLTETDQNNCEQSEQVDVTSLQVAKDEIKPQWEDVRFKDGCQVYFMLEPNAEYKKLDEEMSEQEKREFLKAMQQDVTQVWRNTLHSFLLSEFESSSDLLLIRIVDKCSIKPDKRQVKRSNGFSYKIELWFTKNIKVKQATEGAHDYMLKLKKYYENFTKDIFKGREQQGLKVSMLTFTVKDITHDAGGGDRRGDYNRMRPRHDNWGGGGRDGQREDRDGQRNDRTRGDRDNNGGGQRNNRNDDRDGDAGERGGRNRDGQGNQGDRGGRDQYNHNNQSGGGNQDRGNETQQNENRNQNKKEQYDGDQNDKKQNDRQGKGGNNNNNFRKGGGGGNNNRENKW